MTYRHLAIFIICGAAMLCGLVGIGIGITDLVLHRMFWAGMLGVIMGSIAIIVSVAVTDAVMNSNAETTSQQLQKEKQDAQ